MVIRDSGGLGGALSVRVAECATLEATGDCDFNITVESTFALRAIQKFRRTRDATIIGDRKKRDLHD